MFEDIGLFDPTDHLHDIMSAEQYTSCFRILFNSSYIRRDLSEQALQYLVYPDFSLGIIGGVPSGITVTQKFGEREFPGVK